MDRIQTKLAATACCLLVLALTTQSVLAQNNPMTEKPAASSGSVATNLVPLSLPAPGPMTDSAYAPQPILPGGVVIPLYAPNSPRLKQDRLREPEQYTMTRGVPGRIQSIINIHNPSIEVHTVEPGINTGSAIIVVAGGGHNTLNVGSEAADFVPYFYNYGINTVILRNRLRRDGYKAETDAVEDAMQSIRLLRSRAKEFGIDPNKIGIMGFSAGAELSAPAAVFFEDFDKKNSDPSDPLAGMTSRPDFVGVLYPGPTPYARNQNPPVPRNAPPSFIASSGSGDKVHAIWALEYFQAMLQAGIPNLEMHIYGNGGHAGGLKYRNGTPYGTWQDRFMDWFRDLGYLQKPGVETKAAADVTTFVNQPQRGDGERRGASGGQAASPAPTVGTPAR